MVNLTLTLAGLTLRQIPNRVGMLASVTQAIATSGGNFGQLI